MEGSQTPHERNPPPPPPAAPLQERANRLVEARAKRDIGIGNLCQALANLLADARPLVKPMVESLLAEAAADRERRAGRSA